MSKEVAKRNQSCEAFFQFPKRNHVDELVESWFESRPLGNNKLGSMMREILEAARLSRLYTNHSVRATAITLWSDAQIPSRHIMNISSHRNEDSIKYYNTRPLAEQLRVCSNILSEACSTATSQDPICQEVQSHEDTAIVPAGINQTLSLAVIPEYSQQNAVNTLLGSGGVFNSCQIHSVHVYLNIDPASH